RQGTWAAQRLGLCCAARPKRLAGSGPSAQTLGVTQAPVQPHPVPTPRQTGQIIGSAIGRMSIDDLMRPYAPTLYKTANISVAELRARYLALMVAAALHAVESAGLAPEVETEVARGLYDWARAHPDSHLQALLSTIEETTDAYAE